MTHEAPFTASPNAAAIDWLIRQKSADFDAWEAFADWLQADPAHAEAYHLAQSVEDDLAALPRQPAQVAPPVVQPRRWTRRSVWMSGAVAASLAGLVAFSQFSSSTYRVETAMGDTQEIALSDGSRIALNGGTSLVLDRSDERRVTLERGQATFIVVHRAEAPFRVSVGSARLVNIGTIFDVTRGDGHTLVAVSEGAVAYNPDSDNVRIDAGKRLSVSDESGKALLMAVDPTSVGAWRDGQLVFDGDPLSLVVEEVERTTGVHIRTTSATAEIPFRGALNLGSAESADAARLAADLAALSGTRAVQDAKGWALSK